MYFILENNTYLGIWMVSTYSVLLECMFPVIVPTRIAW